MAVYTILVTGSQYWRDPHYIWHVLDERAEQIVISDGLDLVIRHGACPRGADYMARQWVRQVDVNPDDLRHGRVSDEPFPAQPDLGAPEKFARNIRMLTTAPVPDECQAFILDGSPGSTHCLKHATRAGIRSVVHPRTTSHAQAGKLAVTLDFARAHAARQAGRRGL